ncbi:2-oxoacid:acceptor oxidoreductase subunit alpha [candidate division KSB1 bacterium]|nr:2-oxoacid:acceptor oxidoreductase subunit alpha [candidate division KSB1 bacterium]
MNYKELTVRFCGIAGDGIVSSSRIISGACADAGLHVMVNDIYSAEIRGLGKSTSTIRFSGSKVYSMGDGINALVGLAQQESIDEIEDIREGGSVIYDSSSPADIPETESLASHIPPEVNGYGIPLKTLANQASGSNRGRNIVSMGALCHLYGLPKTIFINQIEKIFKRKGDKVVESNLTAFELGYEYCQNQYPLNNLFVMDKKAKPLQIISGNEAVAHGAMDCGLKFFAGYPITPATKIMEITAKELPKLNGWTIQVEDEIAAIGAVLGASFTGTRAMTATAGPGLSLMSELINLSVMAEISAVIVNVQRGGPATGLPTKVEQGDLNISLYGGAGDSPRVVMAPTCSKDCYTSIQAAFDLAEKYQTPVIFLSDLFLGQRLETDDIKRNINYKKSTRIKPTRQQLKNYQRYALTEDGVSPLIVPGEDGAFYSITGLAHNTAGNPNFESEVHLTMTQKRFRKFKSMVKDLPPVEIIGDADADIGIACWGSTYGAIFEGMQIARHNGVKTKMIKSIMIYPQDEESFKTFFASCKKIIVFEMNFQGQYAALLKSTYNIKPVEVHIPSVDPVSPAKIAAKIMEVNHELTQ